MYSDTFLLFATTISRRGNRNAQTFPTDFGWSSQKLRHEAHEALSLLFQCDQVPPAVICNNAKEMILGEFIRKFKEASCNLRQTEPFTPLLNADEREIMKLKKGLHSKFFKSGTLKRFWDDCVELVCYIRSKTAHSIYELDGEVLETIVSREMSNISQFCEFEWFIWVMF